MIYIKHSDIGNHISDYYSISFTLAVAYDYDYANKYTFGSYQPEVSLCVQVSILERPIGLHCIVNILFGKLYTWFSKSEREL